MLSTGQSNYSYYDSIAEGSSILSFSQGNATRENELSSNPLTLDYSYHVPLGQPKISKPSQSTKKEGTPSRKANRKLPSQPERILDAPNVMRDYFLQLLDWGSNNILGVALTQEVYLWNADTGDVNNLMKVADDQYVSSMAWSASGQYLALGNSLGDVELWDPVSEKRLRLMRGHSARVTCLSWNGSTLTSGSKSAEIHHHDVRIPKHHVGSFMGHEGQVSGLRWSPSGQHLASGGQDKLVKIWTNTINHDTVNDKKLLHSFSEHQAAVRAISWCPWNPTILATGGGTTDRHIRIWNCSTGSSINSVDTGSQVTHPSFSLSNWLVYVTLMRWPIFSRLGLRYLMV